ncbi:MAG TPA: hypothetical protein VFM51_08485 [Solirubrobacterales bacterium]|nr:hypothetical protein [Solirubrobacterales bacterium]
MTVKLPRIKTLLTVAGEDRLNGDIAPLYRLKGRKCCVHSLLGQMI